MPSERPSKVKSHRRAPHPHIPSSVYLKLILILLGTHAYAHAHIHAQYQKVTACSLASHTLALSASHLRTDGLGNMRLTDRSGLLCYVQYTLDGRYRIFNTTGKLQLISVPGRDVERLVLEQFFNAGRLSRFNNILCCTIILLPIPFCQCKTSDLINKP